MYIYHARCHNLQHTHLVYLSIRQHTSAYVSIRQRMLTHVAIILAPVALLPVKAIFSTPGWPVSVAPTSGPSPVTTLSTPAYVSVRQHTSADGSEILCPVPAKLHSYNDEHACI